MSRIFYTLVILSALLLGTVNAERMKGDEAKSAKKRLKDVKKEWKKATSADKILLLGRLSRENERTVSKWLLDVIEDDESDTVASRAAKTMSAWDEEDDVKKLIKVYNKVKEPSRRTAILRWLGRFESSSPLVELRKIGMTKDASAVAAVHALADVDIVETWDFISSIGKGSRNLDARIAATIHLFNKSDNCSLEALAKLKTLESAAEAAHAAIGTEYEVEAIKLVMRLSSSARRTKPGQRAHYYGSLIARVTEAGSFEAIYSARPSPKSLAYAEYRWWLAGFNRYKVNTDIALDQVDNNDDKDILIGLRMLQRVARKLELGAAKDVAEAITPLLGNEDSKIATHAMLAAASTHACDEVLELLIEAWLADDAPDLKATALLAAGQMKLDKFRANAINMLLDDCWYVQSAALDYLLKVRSTDDAEKILAYVEEQKSGRLFAEGLALLVDLTGQDHGDDLNKWKEWLDANKDFTKQDQTLESLRGVPFKRTKQSTAAKFYGLDILSNNVQFALDRSVSMVKPVRLEPNRPGFLAQKADILKRRPEVKRMVREGFLPRFFVAAAELSSALDNMEQDARFGITLFNHEMTSFERTENSIKKRKKGHNWMLSTSIQGATLIKEALISIIEEGKADTILLLSDGDPMSCAIVEQIRRSNAIHRVNIMVVSIHEHMYHRHYMNALASLEGGQIINGEPNE